MGFLEDSGLWLLLSFVIFVSLVFKFGKSALLSMLDERIASIREEIKTAENLRLEAQEMLAQYQRKHKDAVKDADKILADSKAQAAEIKKRAEEDLKETLARREKQLAERLENMKQSAKDEILEYASNLAIAATREIIAENLDDTSHEKLVDQAIADVGKNLH